MELVVLAVVVAVVEVAVFSGTISCNVRRRLVVVVVACDDDNNLSSDVVVEKDFPAAVFFAFGDAVT